MWKEIRMRKIYLLLPALLLLVSDIVTGLFITKVTVPPAAMVDGIAELICDFDLENDTLYSVKWYKGTREFFRYTPKEIPAIKVFRIDGINVDTKFSNESHLYLTSLKLSTSGRYKCEVSADAPSFHTMIKKKDLIVVDPAHLYPVTIQHEDAPYRIGDTLEANCTKISSPAANLTWLLNNQVIGQNNLIEYETTKNSKQLDVAVVGLDIVLQSHHFIDGLLAIRCIAELYDVFKEQAVLYIKESPQVLTSASGDQPSLSFMSDQGYRAISKGLSNMECKNNVNFLIIICFVIFYVNYKKMFR